MSSEHLLQCSLQPTSLSALPTKAKRLAPFTTNNGRRERRSRAEKTKGQRVLIVRFRFTPSRSGEILLYIFQQSTNIRPEDCGRCPRAAKNFKEHGELLKTAGKKGFWHRKSQKDLLSWAEELDLLFHIANEHVDFWTKN